MIVQEQMTFKESQLADQLGGVPTSNTFLSEMLGVPTVPRLRIFATRRVLFST